MNRNLTTWPWVINNPLNLVRRNVNKVISVKKMMRVNHKVLGPILDLITNPIIDAVENQIYEGTND